MELKPTKQFTKNCVINTFKDFEEVVIYKDSFEVISGNTHLYSLDPETGEIYLKNLVDRSRKFKEIQGILVPQKDNARIQDLKESMSNARHRALECIYGYVLSNEWKYWITLTFSPAILDRNDDDQVKYHWSLFEKKMKYYFPDVKILVVPERHKKDGALHLHGFVGECDLDKYLKKAINPHTNQVIKQNGQIVYNISLFRDGFSTCVKLYGNMLKCVNYLTKYVVKDFGTIGYNKKSYFATRNLDFKDKQIVFWNEEQKEEFKSKINLCDFVPYKETNKMLVYRRYTNKT